MLQAIRDKVTGWIAYGIIFLISIPFALWGVNSYLGGGEAAPVAVVNGEEITLPEFDQTYAGQRQRLARMFGGNIPDVLGGDEVLREQVRDQMIENYALRQYISDARFLIGDTELNRIIRSMPEFQRDGRFDAALYETQLRSLGYSPLRFESELRQSNAAEQLQRGISETAFTLPRTRQQYLELGQQTRKLRTLSYTVDKTSISVEESDILAEYEKNKASYLSPEQVKIEYIDVSLEAIKSGISVDAGMIEARYADNLAQYSTAEVRVASHILVKVDDEAESDAAFEKIRSIRARLDAGEDFAQLARELSDDKGSAADGGNLGEIERGVMVQAFEDALFSMAVGEVSEPVKTGFGWHLIQLQSASGGETRSFESVRDELEDEIRTELAESQIFDLVESLANIVYEQSDSLVPAVEQLNLKLETSDWFSRFSGEGVAANSAIREAAFSDEVKRQALNSDAIELGPEQVVFLRVSGIKPAEQQPLEAVRDVIRDRLISEKARDLSRQLGEEALAGLRSGDKSLEELAEQWASSVEDAGFVGRRQADFDNTLRERAFRMPRPEQGPVYDGFTRSNGDFVIIELTEIATGDGQQADELQQQLVQSIGGADFRATVKLLTSRAEIVRTPLEDLY